MINRPRVAEEIPDRDIQGQRPVPTPIIDNYDVSTLLGTGSFAQVYRGRNRRTDRQVALKVVIVDGVLDSKRRKRKEQEGEGGDWIDGGTAMN